MSRQTRAGSATRVVGVRATDGERAEWLRCAKGAGQPLSDWLRSLANHEARGTAIKVQNRRPTSVSTLSPPARSSSSKKTRSRR